MTDDVERCEHGIRWPHPCDDCEAEALKPHNLIAQIEARDAIIATLQAKLDKAVEGLDAMTKHYIALAGCGDCGNWNPLDEPEVKAAQSLIKELRP